jgi:hypothetical protein
MNVTKELLYELYPKYNQMYFEGKLGKCTFYLISKNRTALGWYAPKEDRQGRPDDRIWIGTSVYWTEEALRHVLIHEMVHMYVRRIEGCRHDGVLGHGRRFRRACRRIKRAFGIDVYRCPKVEYINPAHYPKLWERVVLWLIDR